MNQSATQLDLQSVKTSTDDLEHLKKQNFNLQLQIFFLMDKLSSTATSTVVDHVQQIVDLQVCIAMLRAEIEDKNVHIAQCNDTMAAMKRQMEQDAVKIRQLQEQGKKEQATTPSKAIAQWQVLHEQSEHKMQQLLQSMETIVMGKHMTSMEHVQFTIMSQVDHMLQTCTVHVEQALALQAKRISRISQYASKYQQIYMQKEAFTRMSATNTLLMQEMAIKHQSIESLNQRIEKLTRQVTTNCTCFYSIRIKI